MSLHTYTTYVKHILGHTSYILALFVRMRRKNAFNVWIKRAHLSLIISASYSSKKVNAFTHFGRKRVPSLKMETEK